MIGNKKDIINYLLDKPDTKQYEIKEHRQISEYIRQIRLERPVYDETISSKNRYGENVWYKKFYFKEQK